MIHRGSPSLIVACRSSISADAKRVVEGGGPARPAGLLRLFPQSEAVVWRHDRCGHIRPHIVRKRDHTDGVAIFDVLVQDAEQIRSSAIHSCELVVVALVPPEALVHRIRRVDAEDDGLVYWRPG